MPEGGPRPIGLRFVGTNTLGYTLGPSETLVVQSVSCKVNANNASDNPVPVVEYFEPSGKLIGSSFIYPAILKAANLFVVCTFELDFTTFYPLVTSNQGSGSTVSNFRTAGLPDVTLTPECKVTLTMYDHGTFGPTNLAPVTGVGVVEDAIMWADAIDDGQGAPEPPNLVPLLVNIPLDEQGREAPGLTVG